LIRFFNDCTCPDYEHVLEAIQTFSDAKPNALATCDSLLIKQFEENLKQRLQLLDNAEEAQVSSQ
jgi:hypothetical protein